MNQDVYAKLAEPFAITHDKKGMEYITGEQVTSRLNDVLGWDAWSFDVVSHGFDQESDELWVLGRLVVLVGEKAVTREQFGSQKHNRRTSDGAIIDYGFDMKGAATDCLKKCASLIGVGLYLMERDGKPATPERQARPASAPAAGAKPTFEEITAQLGYTRDQVVSESQRMFDNREPGQLNKDEKMRLFRSLEEAKKKERSNA